MQTHHNLHHFFMILHYTLSNDYKYGGLSMIDILLVDDEPRMLELLTLYLTPIGYNCVCATSGEEAIYI